MQKKNNFIFVKYILAQNVIHLLIDPKAQILPPVNYTNFWNEIKKIIKKKISLNSCHKHFY